MPDDKADLIDRLARLQAIPNGESGANERLRRMHDLRHRLLKIENDESRNQTT